MKRQMLRDSSVWEKEAEYVLANMHNDVVDDDSEYNPEIDEIEDSDSSIEEHKKRKKE